jgi:hypothetical protein
MRNAYKIYIENLKGLTYLGYLGVYGRIKLKFIIKNSGVRVVTALNWLRLCSNGGFMIAVMDLQFT